MNRPTDIHQIWYNLELVYKHLRNVSRKFDKDSSPRTGAITDNLLLVRKWGKEQTDRHKGNLESFTISMQTSQKYLQKIWER